MNVCGYQLNHYTIPFRWVANILTQLPIIESLAGQGVSTDDAIANLNLGERQTDLLTLLQSAQGLAGPGPDLSRMGGAESPFYIKDVDISTPWTVKVVNQVQVTNEVNVKQVGTVQVTQAGEWVLQLASGATIPVYVQGGSVQANISQGGISALAELIDVENQRRDAFNTAI